MNPGFHLNIPLLFCIIQHLDSGLLHPFRPRDPTGDLRSMAELGYEFEEPNASSLFFFLYCIVKL